jgi:ribosomal protein S6--L-glutamate ligase/gamma-F420-2:alpha-L-glutamate ligase
MKGLIFINPFLVPIESVHQAERLKEEFNKRNVEIEIVSDGFSRVAIEGKSAEIDLDAPDFAVYLVKDKYLSNILEKGGLRLFNRHEAVRVCDDKGKTYIALAGMGVNFPKTIFGALCYRAELPVDRKWAEKIAKTLGFPIIVKESFGSMGKGVYKADDIDELLFIMEKVKLKPHLFQEYIGERVGVDVRVIVIGGKTVASMERRNDNDFRSNVARGGQGNIINLPDSFKETAESCAKILGLDYCGVDLLYSEDGAPYVCEVNSNAFFSGIEKTTGVNVAKLYAEHIIRSI